MIYECCKQQQKREQQQLRKQHDILHFVLYKFPSDKFAYYRSYREKQTQL